MNPSDRLVVVSNRLPVTIDGDVSRGTLHRSSGGLVSALVPVLQRTGGAWVGWTGTGYDRHATELVNHACLSENYTLEPVFLTDAERFSFYIGFSNEILWPLFHGLPSRCRFESGYWDGYRSVNQKFAEAVERVSGRDSLIWVHDYHLMLLAQALRRRGMRQRTAYFHHIPFPSPDVFETLPWRTEILAGILQFDVIGFQTSRDRNNFVSCVDRFFKNVRPTAGVYPIGVNYAEYAAYGADEGVVEAARSIRKALRTGMILGVDRLDYTKGIPERLAAFQKFLEAHPESRGRVSMIQIVVPSREEIPEYHQLKLHIEALVGRINGQYGCPGWIPVQYFYRSISSIELASYYRAADVALVTPLKDGMNLVAKEFCAARADNQGVLVLSEFAGAAHELKPGALMVNPYDIDAVASSIHEALHMSEPAQRMRMESLRAHVRSNDVFHWARSFMGEGRSVPFISRNLNTVRSEAGLLGTACP